MIHYRQANLLNGITILNYDKIIRIISFADNLAWFLHLLWQVDEK